MILTRLRGGLGNQMFQYAMGRTLSITRDGEPLKLDISGYDTQVQGDTLRSYRLQFFNIKAEIATPKEICNAKYPYGIFSKFLRAFNQKVLRKHYIDFHPELLKKYQNNDVSKISEHESSTKPIYLDGFFQSEKYYLDPAIQETLRNDFKLKAEYISTAMKAIMETIRATPTSVSLHVRRGDYVTNKAANKAQGLCSIEYYEKAITYIKSETQNPHVFVFSDDIEWVKENLALESHFQNTFQDTSTQESLVTYVSSAGLQDYEEMTLMSECKHHIIANSSFSWWGAWLNANPNKIVVAPKQWTPKNSNHPNILPFDWIAL